MNKQHEVLMRHICDGRYIFDETVKLGENDQILDSGTGTCKDLFFVLDVFN